MATIITVHGTGATGLPEGSGWWQVGSRFHTDLRRLVEASDGEFLFEPFAWDGRNSEASRYQAGTALHRRIRELETRGEAYCLLGHSHGGSVICHSLLQARYEKQELRRLRRWITVGTPFVETRKRFLLFSRLTDQGGAAYLIFAYVLFAYLAFLISILTAGADNPTFDASVIVVGALLLLVVYRALHLAQPRKLKMLRRGPVPDLQESIGRKWLALRHKDDEAIHGLRLVRDIRLSPFDTQFAVPTFGFASLFLLPVLMYVLSQQVDYNLLVENIKAWSNFKATPELDADPFERFARNTMAVIIYPSLYLFKLLEYSGFSRTGNGVVDAVVLVSVLSIGFVIGFFVLWCGGIALRLAVMRVGRLLSHGLSLALNWATREQLKKLSFGSDTIGEKAVAADQRPHWSGSVNPTLPADLSDEIAKASDIAAAQSLRKFRSALGTLAFSEQERTVGNVIEEYLTWQELIHTNYFGVPRFRKLLAFAISQNESFRATPEFRSDPDYALVAAWYADIMQPAERRDSPEHSAAGTALRTGAGVG